jgi:hypothetical protein
MEVVMSEIPNPRALPRYDKIPAHSHKQFLIGPAWNI